MSDKPINIYITGGTNQILPNATSASQILTPKSTDMDETIVYSPFAGMDIKVTTLMWGMVISYCPANVIPTG